MGRRTLLLITSILVAAVGTALIGLYVKGADTRATSKQTLLPVVVAKVDLAPGSTAGSSDVEIQQWRKADLPPDYVTDPTSVIGKVTATQIYAKQAILKPMFTAKPAAAKIGITKGHMGISVELSDPERAAGLLTPGSLVNIFSIPNGGGNGGQKTPKIILKSISVIQIGNENVASLSTPAPATAGSGTASNSASKDNVARTVVSLDLDEGQATDLLKANSNGTLYFGVLPTGS
jgi:pilus assembly protein CpaB